MKPKVLLFIDWFLPGTASGGPVRSYINMIEHLKDDYDFFVVTRNTDYCSDEVYETVDSDQWNTIYPYLNVYYFSNENLNRAKLKSVMYEVDYDVLLINGIYSWKFSILPVLLADTSNKRKKTIVSARGMVNPQAFSSKAFKKKLFLKLANLSGLYNNISFHATNMDEAQYIKDYIKTKRDIYVAPNLPRKINEDLASPKHKNTPTRFVNLARISIEKGTHKMLEILRDVKSQMIIDLFGPIYNETYWDRCKQIIEELPSNIIINYKGNLDSDRVPEVLREYDFFVLFSEGENFGHAIIEALAVGCPVIISDQTPWKHLQDKNIGWDLELKEYNKIAAIIDKACAMSDENYFTMSQEAVSYSMAFMNNPELIDSNKKLFK